MGRIRTVKPEFFLNEEMAAHPPLVRLLFLGLLTLADVDGRLHDRPRRIQVQVLPYDRLDVDAALNALAETGQLVRYEVGGERYLEILNFRKHQRITGREATAESQFPAPSLGTILAGKPRQLWVESPDDSGETHDDSSESPDVAGRERKGREVPPYPPGGSRRRRGFVT